MNRKQLTLITLASLSVLGNVAGGYHAYGDYKDTSDLCAKLDRNRCEMVPQVTSLPQGEPQPTIQPVVSADPIGELIAQAAAHGLPTPPKAN